METNGNRDGPTGKKRPREIFELPATPYQPENNTAAVHLYDNGDNSAAQWTDPTTIVEPEEQGKRVTSVNHAGEMRNGNAPEIAEPRYGKRSRQRRKVTPATTQPDPKDSKSAAKPSQRPMVEPKDTLLGVEEVVRRVGMNRSSIYVQMRLGTFPMPIKISVKSVRWIGSEIEAWVHSRPRATEEVGNWRLQKRG